MIKTKHGETEFKGTKHELIADLSCIVDDLYNGILIEEMSQEEAEKLIREGVELGFKDNEELSKELNKELKDAMTELVETFLDILKGKGEDA